MLDDDALRGYGLLFSITGYIILFYSVGILVTCGISFIHLSITLFGKVETKRDINKRFYN